jgi:hypothetical protein
MTPTFDLVLELAPGREPANFYWRIPKGDARTARFKLLKAGQLVDLTNHTVTLTAKRSVYDPTPIFQVVGMLDTVPTSALIELATALVTPINEVFTLGVGVLTAGDYYYRVSARNALGETLASPETSLTITGGSAPAGVHVNWEAVAGATSYKVYGRSTGAELYMATVAAPTVTWLDAGAVVPAGALPTADTTQVEAGKYLAAVIVERPVDGRATLIGTVEIETHA